MELVYNLKFKHRRSIKLFITKNGIEVWAPLKVEKKIIDAFVLSKTAWLNKKLTEQKKSLSNEDFLRGLKDEELSLLTKKELRKKLAFYSQLCCVNYKRVSVKRLVSRWGSCSVLGNLNFNQRLCLLPAEIFDYVVVHELCHLKEMNHGPAFWHLVEQILPDWRQRRQRLKHYPLS